jgi:hypothetical protein
MSARHTYWRLAIIVPALVFAFTTAAQAQLNPAAVTFVKKGSRLSQIFLVISLFGE